MGPWKSCVGKSQAIEVIQDHHFSPTHNMGIVTILEGAEVRIGFYDRVGRDQPRGHPEGAEGPEGWPRG